VFESLQRLAAARAALPHLDASVPSEIPALEDPGILPVLRRHPLGPMLALYNVTDDWRPWPWWRLADLGLLPAVDALAGNARMAPGDDGNVWLAPYAAHWLVAPA
jgi:amylosucrase